MSKKHFIILICFISTVFFTAISAQTSRGQIAAKPLYRDPVYDGAADPVVIWNEKEKKWFMLYTNRRATIQHTTGVKWVHDTRIGIAEPDGTWRMWYNNERDGKSIYYADSKDLYRWEDKGKALGDRGGEGPKVFRWKNRYWMIVDNWAGLGVYASDDLVNWKRQQKRILEEPGKGAEDAAMGGHPDIVVQGERAYIFYFSHPGRAKTAPSPPQSVEARRSLIQVAELQYKNGEITCDRNQPVFIRLKPTRSKREK